MGGTYWPVISGQHARPTNAYIVLVFAAEQMISVGQLNRQWSVAYIAAHMQAPSRHISSGGLWSNHIVPPCQAQIC